MIPGLNTNIEHDGLTWHIQTEDQGAAKACFVTQVFRGGVVVATRTTPYPPEAALGRLLGELRAAHRETIAQLTDGALAL